MNPPKRSRFMGTSYSIAYPPVVIGPVTEAEPDGERRWGQTDHEARSIEVEQGLAHDHKCEIVLHETIHQLWHMLGIESTDEEIEERVATVLSRALIGHMRDNKLFWAYLRSGPPKE